MRCTIKSDSRKQLGEEGNTFVEDVMILAVIVLPLAAVGALLVQGLQKYFEALAFLISSPFP
jgi:Flp pilus assembly pilin Flp